MEVLPPFYNRTYVPTHGYICLCCLPNPPSCALSIISGRKQMSHQSTRSWLILTASYCFAVVTLAFPLKPASVSYGSLNLHDHSFMSSRRGRLRMVNQEGMGLRNKDPEFQFFDLAQVSPDGCVVIYIIMPARDHPNYTVMVFVCISPAHLV